ncbi:hypothetical protein PSECIP111854_04036 [Pseudoalteromonas sp. CIP111854]|uniref:Uncharacterized protein n=1 Tax=Pseudoalteromonas holothuriae TaxID=2963714 RepID=A0A9W4R5N6_9GAMM|nr:hypothetical protein PSECIP111854_04036 [Pseudoalteromonas sp. CIP111854]
MQLNNSGDNYLEKHRYYPWFSPFYEFDYESGALF